MHEHVPFAAMLARRGLVKLVEKKRRMSEEEIYIEKKKHGRQHAENRVCGHVKQCG